MSSEHWQQTEEIFNAALERGPSERAAFLSEACGEDASMRSAIDSLLAHHEQANTFIESPAFSISDLDEKHEPLAGQTVGNFTIIQLLGEGGLGQVYPAQDNKLGRKVALKFLPSFYTKDKNRLRRFTQEARSVTPSMNLPAMKCN